MFKNEETKLKLEIKSLLKFEQKGVLEDVISMAITTLTQLQQKLQKKIVI